MLKKFLILSCLLIIISCGSAPIRKKVKDLDHSIDDYAFALRWSRPKDAAEYHVRQDGSKTELDLSVMENIRVMGFTITEKTLNDDITEAVVKVELNYSRVDYGTLKKVDLHQTWWFEPDSKKWFLQSEFPNFK